QVRILLQDAATPHREDAPLLALAQRLPSVFELRQTDDPVDDRYPSAYAFNDTGGALFRPLGQRFEGEGWIEAGHDARHLDHALGPVWERSRPCAELRARG